MGLFPRNMVIFHSYVSLPGGTTSIPYFLDLPIVNPMGLQDSGGCTARWSKIKPQSVMTWARAMVANRLAADGDQWTEHQVRHNSGTCRWGEN